MCTMCTFVCTLTNNGTRLQALNTNALSQMCTMCTICARARMWENSITLIDTLSLRLKSGAEKKHSHVRKIYLYGTHGTHLSESFIYKGFPVFTFFKNPKHMVHIVHINNNNW